MTDLGDSDKPAQSACAFHGKNREALVESCGELETRYPTSRRNRECRAYLAAIGTPAAQKAETLDGTPRSGPPAGVQRG